MPFQVQVPLFIVSHVVELLVGIVSIGLVPYHLIVHHISTKVPFSRVLIIRLLVRDPSANRCFVEVRASVLNISHLSKTGHQCADTAGHIAAALPERGTVEEVS